MNESSDDQADLQARYELLHDDGRASGNYCESCGRSADITRVVRKYMKNIQNVYIGDSARAPAEQLEHPQLTASKKPNENSVRACELAAKSVTVVARLALLMHHHRSV